MDTRELVNQHDEIVDQMGTVRTLLDMPNSSPLSSDIGRRLDVLAATLALHLSMEDREFYPVVMQSSNETVRSTSERYFVEMGHLKRAFLNFREEWKSDRSIQMNFREFVTQADGIFSLVEKRIHLENTVLFPLWKASLLCEAVPSVETSHTERGVGMINDGKVMIGNSVDPFSSEEVASLKRHTSRRR